MNNKVILGTAKLGKSDYGFSSKEIHSSSYEILNHAHNLGIEILDTSPRYGDAEKLIGDYHLKNENRFRICTKIDNLIPNHFSNEKKIYNSVINSINKTNIKNIEILYLHQNDLQIISNQNIIQSLIKMKSDGLVKKIGVSVYSREECEFAIKANIYDVIQLPISILDSYIYSNEVKSEPTKEIIARSVFLQGILFNNERISSEINQSIDLLRTISIVDELLTKYKIDLLTLACSFVLSLQKVNYMIVGSGSKKNLTNIVQASKNKLQNELCIEIEQLSSNYKEWGNPRNWKS
jgi:uncharacterized protein